MKRTCRPRVREATLRFERFQKITSGIRAYGNSPIPEDAVFTASNHRPGFWHHAFRLVHFRTRRSDLTGSVSGSSRRLAPKFRLACPEERAVQRQKLRQFYLGLPASFEQILAAARCVPKVGAGFHDLVPTGIAAGYLHRRQARWIWSRESDNKAGSVGYFVRDNGREVVGHHHSIHWGRNRKRRWIRHMSPKDNWRFRPAEAIAPRSRHARQVLERLEPLVLVSHDADEHGWQFIGTS